MIMNFFNQKKNIYLLIFIASFLIYGNALQNRYALDDAIVITENDFVKKGLSGIPDILNTELFTGFFGVKKNLVDGGRYRPLSLITFAIEYEFFGLNPWLSHLLNLLFYALSGIFLYLVLLKLFLGKFKNDWDTLLPILATLLWLFHPLHTEVVANIKGRDEIFSLLGSLMSLYYILKYLDTQKLIWLGTAILCFFFALLSKEMTITFLMIIPLSLYFFTKKTLKEILIPTASLLIPTFIFLYLRQSIMGEPASTGANIPQELMNHSFLGTSFSEQYATIIYTLILYIKLLFIPFPLTFDYYPFHIQITNFSNIWVLLSVAVHLGLVYIAIKGLKKKSIWSFGILFYAITFSIVSNILFPIGTFMSERFMYMPSIGWALIMAYALLKLSQWKPLLKFKGLPLTSLIILLIPMSIMTFQRNKAWANDYILFTTDVQTSVNSAKSNTSAGGKTIEEVDKLEKILREKSRSKKTITKAIEALDLRDEEKAELLNSEKLSDITQNIKKFNHRHLLQAIGYIQQAVKIHPTYVDALLLLGNAQYKLDKDFDKVWQSYEQILKMNPRHPLVAQNWTFMMNDTIEPLRKINYHKQLLKYNPNLFENNYQIGNLYGRQLNQLEPSISYLEKALKIDPKQKKVYKDLGVAYGMSSQFDKALKMNLKSLELDPNDHQILINTGVTYQMMGNMEKAKYYFQLAQEKANQNKAKK